MTPPTPTPSDTIVINGIVKTTDNEGTAGIPLLSGIPILGPDTNTDKAIAVNGFVPGLFALPPYARPVQPDSGLSKDKI